MKLPANTVQIIARDKGFTVGQAFLAENGTWVCQLLHLGQRIDDAVVNTQQEAVDWLNKEAQAEVLEPFTRFQPRLSEIPKAQGLKRFKKK
jgi:hypothetical protein